MLLYCLLKFKLTRIYLLLDPFCDINNSFNGKSNYKLFDICFSNRWDFFHQPVLPHISTEAPTIRNEKRLIQCKKKLSEMVKVYDWFISKGGNFEAKQF